MALVSTILGTKTRVQLKIDNQTVITLDASIHEDHSRESPPTEFPLEDGTNISDHIIVKPHTLVLKGIKSDSPISLSAAAITTAIGAATTGIGALSIATPIVAGASYALTKASQNETLPSKTTYEQLLMLQEQRKKFEVLTSLKLYKDMFIKSIKVPRDSTTGQVLHFEVTLSQLILVSPKVVNIKVFKNGVVAAPENDEGTKEKKSRAKEFVEKGRVDGWQLITK